MGFTLGKIVPAMRVTRQATLATPLPQQGEIQKESCQRPPMLTFKVFHI